MTCLELLKKEHPEYLKDWGHAPATTCPCFLGYAPRPINCFQYENRRCRECWEQEVVGHD